MLGEVDMDDGAAPYSSVVMSDGNFPTLKPVRRTEMGGSKVGRPRKLAVYNPRDLSDGGNAGEDGMVAGPSTTGLHSEGFTSSGKRRKQHLPFTVEDLDIMCAVPSPRSGAPCRQSLTCKSHSISSKRAVSGRRKPFDSLLQEFKDNNSRKSPQADIPRPLATKVYCSSHSQRMRAVITGLYRESVSGRCGLSQSEQHLALEGNPQEQQALMSLNKGLQ